MTFFWDSNDAYYMREFLRLSEFSFSKDLDTLEKIVKHNEDIDDIESFEEYTDDEKYELFCLLGQFDSNNKIKNKELKKQMDESFSFATFDETSLKLIQSFIESIVRDTDGKFYERAAKKYRQDAFLAEYCVLLTKIEFQLNPEFQEKAYGPDYRRTRYDLKVKI